MPKITTTRTITTTKRAINVTQSLEEIKEMLSTRDYIVITESYSDYDPHTMETISFGEREVVVNTKHIIEIY